jgi:hypothetical protein
LPCAKLKESDELHPQVCPHFGGRLLITWGNYVSLVKLPKQEITAMLMDLFKAELLIGRFPFTLSVRID